MIVDSNKNRSFVHVQREVGKSKVQCWVVVTTAWLDFYLGQLSLNLGTENRLRFVAAEFAHELGQALDQLDHIRENRTQIQDGQASQIRADTIAVDLLRASGIPEESLYEDLNFKLQKESAQQTSITKSIGPDLDLKLRLGYQRVLLTNNRAIKGFQTETFEVPKIQNDVLLAELESLQRQSLKYHFQMPLSLDEFARRLENLLSQPISLDQETHRTHEIEINGLYLWLDQYLKSNPTSASDSFNLKKFRVSQALVKPGRRFARHYSLCATRSCLENLFREVDGIEGLPLIPHFEQMKGIEYFSTGDIENLESVFIKKVLLFADDSAHARTLFVTEFAPEILRWYSTEKIRNWLASLSLIDQIHFFRSAFDSNQKSNKVKAFVAAQLNLNLNEGSATPPMTISSQVWLEWARYFHLELTPRLQDSLSSLDPALAYFKVLVPSPESQFHWSELLNRKASHGQQQLTLEILNSIWQSRGLWAYLEFISPGSFTIDWFFVAEKIGIDRNGVLNQVRAEFVHFLVAYTERLSRKNQSVGFEISSSDGISEELFAKGTLDRLGQARSNPRSKPKWINESLETAILKVTSGFAGDPFNLRFKKLWLKNIYFFEPGLAHKRNLEVLIGTLKRAESQDLQMNQLDDLFAQALERNFCQDPGFLDRAEALLRAPLQTQYRSKALRYFFLEDSSFQYGDSDWSAMSPEAWQKVYPEMKKLGLVKDFIELENILYSKFLQNSQNQRQIKADPIEVRRIFEIDLYKILSSLSEVVKYEIKSNLQNPNMTKIDYLASLEQTVSSLTKASGRNAFPGIEKIADLFILAARRFPLTLKERIEVFERLTRVTLTYSTDLYFTEKIFPELRANDDFELLQRIATWHRFSSHKLESNVAEDVIKKSFAKAPDKAPDLKLYKLFHLECPLIGTRFLKTRLGGFRLRGRRSKHLLKTKNQVIVPRVTLVWFDI